MGIKMSTKKPLGEMCGQVSPTGGKKSPIVHSVASDPTANSRRAGSESGDGRPTWKVNQSSLEAAEHKETSEELVERFCHDLNRESKQETNYSTSATQKYPVLFRWIQGGHNVSISGSYDNWASTVPLVRSDSHQYVIVEVPLGVFEYKYLVDDNWMCDPDEEQTSNEAGKKNNCKTITHGDYNVLTALSSDGCGTGDYESDRVPRGWSQTIPLYNSSVGYCREKPPMVPPFINDSLLAKETALHSDLHLLPEPNMVVLNHVYATAVKDGVIVLSSTWRYRRKYITTILYKPF